MQAVQQKAARYTPLYVHVLTKNRLRFALRPHTHKRLVLRFRERKPFLIEYAEITAEAGFDRAQRHRPRVRFRAEDAIGHFISALINLHLL